MKMGKEIGFAYPERYAEVERLINRNEKQFKKDQEKVRREVELHLKTVQFWHLQLQFLSMSTSGAYFTFRGIYRSDIYNDNKFTEKITKILINTGMWSWTEEDFACLCTHFALQLSGMEE